jgi:hypothetical protein
MAEIHLDDHVDTLEKVMIIISKIDRAEGLDDFRKARQDSVAIKRTFIIRWTIRRYGTAAGPLTGWLAMLCDEIGRVSSARRYK